MRASLFWGVTHLLELTTNVRYVTLEKTQTQTFVVLASSIGITVTKSFVIISNLFQMFETEHTQTHTHLLSLWSFCKHIFALFETKVD